MSNDPGIGLAIGLETSLGQAADALARRLAAAGIEAPAREARLMVALAAEVTPETVFTWPERPFPAAAARRLAPMARRRLAAEPLSRILGSREFWSLRFRVTPATLDPRADSETLIEAALAYAPDRKAALRVIDFGTGTGCLLAAVLTERPNAWGLGIDRSLEAAAVANANLRDLGLGSRSAVIVGDWADALGPGEADLVLANPPYIAAATIPNLERAVRDYDPLGALNGGADGLDAYRALIPMLPRVLKPTGCAVIELGEGQAAAVTALAQAASLQVLACRPDLAGIARALVLAPLPRQKPGSQK